jgi:hypothetical protein
MYLKQNKGNVTVELLAFFLILAVSIWTSIGIFEAYKTRTTLSKITYFASTQIAIDEKLRDQWQNAIFVEQLAKNNNLQNLKVEINCENNICKNGNLVQIRTRANSANGIFKFQMQSEKYAITNKYESD